MVEPEQPDVELDPFAGGEATRKSIWPAIYPELLRSCASTARRSSSSTTAAPPSGSRCGSTSWPRSRSPARTTARWRARSGSSSRSSSRRASCRAWWPRRSLELGIDMGAVDLVLQVESPKSVTAGLQRIGRAGHGVGDVSKGRIFPKFRADLLECAVVARRMREGLIERTVVPRNPLDVLAQQIVAIAASARDASTSTRCTRWSSARTPSPSSRARSSRTCSTCSTAATRPRSSASCARASCGTAWPARSARARAPARSPSPTRARSPTAACSPSTCPTAAASASSTRRWSTRRGRARSSCSARRAGGSRRSRATASSSRRRRACPGAVPFWKGDGVGRPKELGEAIGAFAR